SPAIAILDVVMPKMGGMEAAKRLTTRFSGLPIVFTSGYSQDSESVAPAAANAHYLQKPYSPLTLGRQVREILDKALATTADLAPEGLKDKSHAKQHICSTK